MRISTINIRPNPVPDSQVLATAEVILNGSLSLRGIKILRGRYGLFMAFPGSQAGLPRRAYEARSMRFRMELQSAVLEAYRGFLASPISLFAACAT